MTNTLLKLRKKIPENIGEILSAVFGTCSALDIKTFIVGATARDLIFEYVYGANIRRATEDIDFGIAVESWSEYEKLKKVLIESKKFKDDKKVEQRIWWKKDREEMKVDLVPFGEIENPAGQIAFPPDGDFVMSTIGFKEAYENSVPLEIDKNVTIRIASLAGLVLLKFIAYNDRPLMRRRDVQDIFFIAGNYLDAGNEDRLYNEKQDADLLDDDFDYRVAGARMLGRDVAKLLSGDTAQIISNLLADENTGGSLQRFARIISESKYYDEDEYKIALETFSQLKKGIFERLHKFLK